MRTCAPVHPGSSTDSADPLDHLTAWSLDHCLRTISSFGLRHFRPAISYLLPSKAHDQEVRILIDTLTSRNLDERKLVKIANDVLGVKVPDGWK